MGVIFDILGSMVVRAAIISIILNLMINLHEALYKNTERMYLSETTEAVSKTISADLKLAGYRCSTATLKRFPVARSNEMSFRADYDDDGDVDVIRYYLSSSGTYRTLYRSVNGGSVIEVATNVTTFYVRYYEIDGTAASSGTNIPNIKSVYVRIIMESRNTESSASNGTSESAARVIKWDERFFPENL